MLSTASTATSGLQGSLVLATHWVVFDMALKKPGKAPNAGLPQVRKSALKVPSVRKDAPTSKQASTEQPAGKLKAEVLKRATAANATAGTSQKESQPKVGKKTKPEERTEKKTKPKERTEKKTKSEERGAKKTKPEERTEKKVTPEGRTEKKKPEERNETDRKKAQADDQKRLPPGQTQTADGNKKEGKKEADPKKAPKKGKEKVEEKKPARKAEVVEAECAPGTSSSSFSKKPRVEKHEGRKAEQTEKLKTLAAQLEKSSKPTVKAPTTPPTKRFRMKSPASSVTTDASSARYKTSSNKEKAEAAMAKKLKGSLEQCVKEAEARAEEDSQQMLMLLDEICGEADKENTAPACNKEEASMDEAASDPPDSDDEDQEEEENQKKQEAGQGEADLEEQEEEEEEADTEAEEEEAEEQVDGEGDKSETGGDESQEEEESEEESEEDDKESDKDTGANDTEMTGDQKEGKEKGTELVEAVKNTQRNSSFAEHVSAPQFIGRPSFQYPSISCTYNQVP